MTVTNSQHVSLWARIWLAFILPWKLLFNATFAAEVARVARLARPEPAETELPGIEPELSAQVVAPPAGPDPTPALQLLSILQREGRLIDFLQEDVSGFSDAEIGAAARVVHEGCQRGLHEYIELQAVRTEAEGAPVVLEPGFDPTRTRLTGNVVGSPPFRGRLAHHGWMVTGIHFPSLTDGHDPKVVAPAEVEL